MRPLLAVVAILKNEAASIRALLESVKGVADHYTILDTGSTDHTQDQIARFVAENPLTYGVSPEQTTYYRNACLVVEEPFISFDGISDRKIIDFAATRNRALELEAVRDDAAVFTLFLSGDETLENGAELRAFLEAHRDAPEGAYRVMIRKGTARWQYPRVLRVDAGWRYRFPIHEMPFSPSGTTEGPLIPGPEVVYHSGDQPRLFERMKTVDIPVLTVLADKPLLTHEDHMSRARALLHLAQTHENLALEHNDEPGSAKVSHLMAAMAFYWRRADLEGDPDEKHYALFRYFDIAGKLGFVYTSSELCSRLQMLAEMDPRRPEVRYLLAVHASQMDVTKGGAFALEAVRVARDAKAKPPAFSTDSRVEWLALQIAAECAKKLKKGTQAKAFAEAGIAAGGPAEMFAEYLA